MTPGAIPLSAHPDACGRVGRLSAALGRARAAAGGTLRPPPGTTVSRPQVSTEDCAQGGLQHRHQ